jgi:hypothetical protein
MEEKWDFERLATSSPETLSGLIRQGKTPGFKDLVGWEFRGYNQPYITRILGFQKFKKGFFLAEDQGLDSPEVMGYNVPVVQNGLYGRWIALPDEHRPKRYGFYRVYRVRPEEVDNKYPNALLLNYGIPRNGLNPARLLRDSLVQVDPGNPDLFLGEARFAIGKIRVFPSHFVIERYNKVLDQVR